MECLVKPLGDSGCVLGRFYVGFLGFRLVRQRTIDAELEWLDLEKEPIDIAEQMSKSLQAKMLARGVGGERLAAYVASQRALR